MLSLQDISIQFNSKPLFQHFNVHVKKGEKAVVKGPSGSGKTTIINTILGYQSVQAGTIKIEDKLLNSKTVKQLRRKMAWLPQELPFQERKVEEIIQLPFSLKYNAKNAPSAEKIEHILERLGLSSQILKQPVINISGGEKQRIGLAITLLLERPILLLDEPTNHLDKVAKQKVIDCIFSKKEQTVLSTSHDEDWIQHCDKIIEV